MSTSLTGSSSSLGQSEHPGRAFSTTSLVAGITGATLTALAAVLTFTLWLEATPFNGPLAFVAYVGVPAALVGIVCGVLGLKSDARRRALAGLVLSVLTIAAWFAIVVMAPYPEP